MWPKAYKDYPTDQPLLKERVETGPAIIGCEMHDLNGWGDEIRHRRKKHNGIFSALKRSFSALFAAIFTKKNTNLENHDRQH